MVGSLVLVMACAPRSDAIDVARQPLAFSANSQANEASGIDFDFGGFLGKQRCCRAAERLNMGAVRREVLEDLRGEFDLLLNQFRAMERSRIEV
jgi:hypothetical protein